jgi:hypothetical protein
LLIADIKDNNHLEGEEDTIKQKISISRDTIKKLAISQLDAFSYNGIKLSNYLSNEIEANIQEY